MSPGVYVCEKPSIGGAVEDLKVGSMPCTQHSWVG